jgi:4-hydroxymandelate oxidase
MKDINKKGRFISIQELDKQAAKKLPKPVYDFYAGGSGDEISLGDNISSYREIKLKNRVLVDVSNPGLSTTLLGQQITFPVLIAPMAFQRLAHPDGERAVVSASGESGTIMIASTLSSVPLADICAQTDIPPWFQLYIYKDRAVTRNLVTLAYEAGFQALVVTVDAPVYGKRERELRGGFELPPQFEMKHLADAGLKISADMENAAGYLSSLLDPGLTWKDIEWLRSISPMPVLLKGILSKEDAVIALENEVAAIIVSNHGGRQLDTAAAPIEVLPEIAEAVDKGMTILIDGGIRRGTDIVKAIALGADAVLIGRPVLWALAVRGRQGVLSLLEMLKSELAQTMALCGCTSIKNIEPGIIRRPAKQE